MTTRTSPDAETRRLALYRHARWFYALALLVPWSLWLPACWTSRVEPQTLGLRLLTTALGLLGLFAPCVVAAVLIGRDPRLRADVRARLTLRGVRPTYAVLAILAMPLTLLAAIALSVALGGDPGQFGVRLTSGVAIGLVPGWLTVTLAPLAEELGWHTYGTDALARRWTVWRTTLVFAVFWALWHVPLSGIKGSYQAEVAHVGALASANFLFSVWPFLIIMNWLYYRCGRNVWVAVAFHLSANVGNELFLATPDTKVLQTALLLPCCAAILWRERHLFFTPPPGR